MFLINIVGWTDSPGYDIGPRDQRNVNAQDLSGWAPTEDEGPLQRAHGSEMLLVGSRSDLEGTLRIYIGRAPPHGLGSRRHRGCHLEHDEDELRGAMSAARP